MVLVNISPFTLEMSFTSKNKTEQKWFSWWTHSHMYRYLAIALLLFKFTTFLMHVWNMQLI